MKNRNKPTSFDIAYRAGVSQSTVSRALRNSPLVNEETRLKVQAVARELHYKVDKNARNLRSQQTKTLALLLFEDHGTGDSLINPFFLAMLASILRASSQRGYDVLVSFQQFSDDWQNEYEDANRADGIIFLGYGDYTTYVKKLNQLEDNHAHCITWGPVLKGQPGVSIGCDNYSGALDACEYLIGLKRQKIAFIGNVSNKSPEFKQRYEGYCAAHKKSGLSLHENLQIDAETSEGAGYQAIKQLLDKNITFDAVFSASDLIAIGAMKAIEEHGFSIPADISVMGFDDIPMASYTHPPLSTVQQNTMLAGEMLVEGVLQLIDGKPFESTLIPTKIIIRGSCSNR